MAEYFRLQDPVIGELLSASQSLRVPDYQRDYSWESVHVLDFWNDITRFQEETPLIPTMPRRYFLGAVMLARQSEDRLVIDGQQRLATVTLLLIVIRDALASIDPHQASVLHALYIARDDQYRITLNVTDRDFFRECYQAYPDKPNQYVPKKRSCKLIKAAYELLSTEVRKRLETKKTDDDRRQYLKALYKTVIDSLQVICIEASDADHAVAMFETLNDRGVGLSTSDLLKSWLLMKASASTRRELLNSWQHMENHAGEGKLTPLLREAWLSKHGDVKARALYSEIKKYLAEHKRISPKAFVDSIRQDIETLVKFRECRTGNAIVDTRLRALRYIGASKACVVLLSVNNTLGEKYLLATCNAIESLAIRHKIKFGYLDSAFDNSLYASCKVFTEQRDFLRGIEVLVGASPADDEVLLAGKRTHFRGSAQRLAKVILAGLEEWLRHDALGLKPDTKEVQLEHIRPRRPRERKNPSPGWLRRINSLGNLTVLLRDENIKLSNKPFRSKRVEYKKSRLAITQSVAKMEKWSNKAIDMRRDYLLGELVKCWPQGLIRETSKKTT
jgi:hypothetical protein